MRTGVWSVRAGSLVLVLMMVIALFSCGGGGANLSKTPTAPAVTNNVVHGTAEMVRESEIGNLPAWQQEMFSDPGWNQPYIAPREGELIPPPSYAELLAFTAEDRARGGEVIPSWGEDAGKAASWNKGRNPASTNIGPGEYETVLYNQRPPYGCNFLTDSQHGHATDDVLLKTASPLQRISFVKRGMAGANWFNHNVASQGNDEYACVYQLYSSLRSGDPEDMNWATNTADYEEIAYRADLTATSLTQGSGPSDPDCTVMADPHRVKGWFWKRFCALNNAVPNGVLNPLNTYEMLVAPSGDESGPFDSPSKVTAYYQEFNFPGDPCMGNGAMIVGLRAADTKCTKFNGFVADSDLAGNGDFYRPVYGVIMKRWKDMMAPTMAGPWETLLGWPVAGPTTKGNGQQFQDANGVYYLWGMWFEHGFVWWKDYDQVNYAASSDVAQVYVYSGEDNVYCDKGTYDWMAPDVYYGGSGALGVTVVCDSYNQDPSDPGMSWVPLASTTDADFPQYGRHYKIPGKLDDLDPLGNTILPVFVSMHAQGYGGVPGMATAYGDCMYKYYVWAFRNGFVAPAGTLYDPAQAFQSPYYEKMGLYIVRVQVTDSTNARAYGDSLPLRVGAGGGGGGIGDVLVVRADGGAFNANYDALITDLDASGIPYGTPFEWDGTPGDALAAADGKKVVIWYAGGPGTSEPGPNLSSGVWTDDMRTEIHDIAAAGIDMLIMSQTHGFANFYSPNYNFATGMTPYSGPWGMDNLNPYGQGPGAPGGPRNFDEQIRGCSPDWYNGFCQFAPLIGYGNAALYAGYTVGWNGLLSGYGNAERYNGAGASGTVPASLTFSGGLQVTSVNHYNDIWNPGIQCAATGYKAGLSCDYTVYFTWLFYWSYGLDNETTPGHGAPADFRYSMYPGNSQYNGANDGPSATWFVAYPWSQFTIAQPAGMGKELMLQNILAWLDDTINLGGGGAAAGRGAAGGFSDYNGPPEIISVKPQAYYDPAGLREGQTSLTGLHYPDQTSVDIYRDTAVGTENRIVHSRINAGGPVVGEDGLNGNDVDFQFKWYGYYWYGADGVYNTADDQYWYDGVLVNKNAHVWNRDDLVPAAQRASILTKLDANKMYTFYYNTTNSKGGETIANYGTNNRQLEFHTINDGAIGFEAVAHWPSTLDAQVLWQMFPGQHTPAWDRVSNTWLLGGPQNLPTLEYGNTAQWTNYFGDFDVDRTAMATPGYVPIRAARGRLDWWYLWQPFSQQAAKAQGRYVEYNYSKIVGFEPDVDRDGTQGEDAQDKFPVRCRVIADLTAYQYFVSVTHPGYNVGTGPWQNHWVDPLSFVEGGCYVVANGPRPVQVMDNPALPNPDQTVVAGVGADNYNITLDFIVVEGIPVYSGTATFTRVSPALTVNVPLPGVAQGNNHYALTNVNLPAGTWTARVTVTDGIPSTAFYQWANAFSVPLQLFFEDFEAGNLTQWSVTNNYGTLQWVNRVPTDGANFPAYSGTRVAGHSYQPAPGLTLDYSVPGWLTQLQLSGGGRNATATKTWTIEYYRNGYMESCCDDLYVYVYVAGSLVTSWDFYALLGYAPTLTQGTFSASAGQLINVNFYSTGDVWAYYGPQIDNVKIY